MDTKSERERERKRGEEEGAKKTVIAVLYCFGIETIGSTAIRRRMLCTVSRLPFAAVSVLFERSGYERDTLIYHLRDESTVRDVD